MRRIMAEKITEAAGRLCIKANVRLRPDVYQALKTARAKETNSKAKGILQALIDNADCARDSGLAICQDTGLAYVFVELGQEVLVCGGELVKAIDKGVARGYQKGALRNSVVRHPLKRGTTPGFSPAVTHIDIVRGDKVKLTVFPKGFGSENKGQVKMFVPTCGIELIKDFVVSAVEAAGADACPPYVVGVGIGGGLDKAALLAKQALLRPLGRRNPDKLLARLEKDLFLAVNGLKIGPMGLGGRATCLGVRALAYPTHIAGLPVAVNISCHALRSAEETL